MGSAIDRLQKRLYGAAPSAAPSGADRGSAIDRVQSMVYRNAPYTVQKERSYAAKAAAKEQESQKKQEDPGFFERVGSTVKGVLQRQASGYAGAAENALELTRHMDTLASTSYQRAQQELKNAAHYRDMLKRGTLDDGTVIDDAMRARLERMAELSEKRAAIGQKGTEEVHKPITDLIDKADAYGDRMSAGAAESFDRAKQGAGTAGRIAVDLAGALGDVATDAGANLLLPGLGTAARVARTYGHGAEAAEDKDLGIGRQALYGAGSAALGEGINRLFGGNPILEKATGKGALDDLLLPNLGKTLPGRMVKSGLGEAIEEGVESIADPFLQQAALGKEQADPLDWKEVGYDALIGGLVGGLTGISKPKSVQEAPAQTAGTAQDGGGGMDTPAVQDGAQGALEPVRVGRVTTIKNPYQGVKPIQTQKNTAAIPVDSGSVERAQNRINGARGLESSLPGKGFKATLKEAYKSVFKSAKGVPVNGVTFDGKPYTVDINNNVPGKVISDTNLTAEKLALLDILPQIVQNGEYVGSGEYVRHGSREKPVVRYDYFETPIEIDGRTYIAKFDVEAYPTVNNYRTHQIAKIDLTQAKGRLAGPAPVPSSAVSGPVEGTRPLNVDSTIPQSAEHVNSVDPLLKLILGGKRVDQGRADNDQFAELAERGDVGVDAAGKLYQINPEDHIDRRSMDSVAGRSLNAFQFDHPELHGYYRKAAEALIADADLSLQFPMTRSYARGMQGNEVHQKVQASAHLRRAMDETGLTRAQLIDAAERIIHDKGQENVKAAKQVELILDHMLSDGWITMAGDVVFADRGYLAAKEAIAGSLPLEDGGDLPDGLDALSGGEENDGLGAADAGFDPYSRLQNQTDRFYPEGPNAARPVDVPMEDSDGRKIPKSASTVMGAQGTGEDAVRMLERQIVSGELSFDTIHDADAVGRAQRTVSDKGFGGALEQYRQAVSAGVATKDNTTLGQQLLLQAMREGNTEATAELLTLYTRNSTTAAQAMQAQSIFRKLSPEGQLTAIQKAVSELNEKHGTDVELEPEDVADFLNAETDEVRREVTERMVQKAAQQVPGTFRAKFDTLRYLAMLGNPRTHIRNILGNTFFQIPVAVKNRVGAAAEGIAYKVSGGKTERTKSLFGVNPFGKLAAEARADWANVKDFLGESSKYQEGQTSLWDIEQKADAFSSSNPFGRGINRAADFNSRALAAEDTAAKKWIYTQSLAGYLKANGCRSMADAAPALLNRARDYAAQEALRNTFNDKNAFSDAVSKLGGMTRSDNPFVRGAGYITEGVLPFKRTPANIAVRAVEYSPVGAVLGAVETVRGAKAGDLARVASGLDRTAAGVSGTALLAAGFLAAGAGYVTGGEDEDEKQAAFDDLTGHQAYALELKNGTSVTLDWLAPEAIPFFMGVELYRQGLENGLSWEEALETVKNASAPMLEMSMLQGLDDTFENAAYAKNRGESVLGALVTSALTNYATQIFPTIGGQLERSGEDVRMTTYTDKNGMLPTDLQYTLGKVSQKIPGWDYQQIPYIDAWGREEETGDPMERAVNNLFNPAYVSQVDVDKVERELQRVKEATGDGGVFPQRAGRSITINGEKKDLTAEEYQTYAKALGRTRYQMLKDGTRLPAYRSMSDGEKAAYIGRLYQYADQQAKAAVSDYAPEAWVRNAKSAQRELGVSPAEYLALYEQYGSSVMSGRAYEKTKQAVQAGLTVGEYVSMKRNADKDGSGSVTKSEAMAALQGKQNRVDLWDLICTTSAKNPYA